MIKTPTLFVLGAGASQPYGYPLGSGLRSLICQATNVGDGAASAIVRDGQITKKAIQEFAGEFHRSGLSIDDFLSRHKKFVEIGKLLIAANLLVGENHDRIFSEGIEDDWYKYFWKILAAQATTVGDLAQNRVKILTFNYDRSLEYFLRVSAKATFGVDDSAATHALKAIQISHLYGSTDWEGKVLGTVDPRPYKPEIRSSDLVLAAGGINIMPEGRDDSEEFKTGRDWFNWARRGFILGFSFDPTNCERLGFFDVINEKHKLGKPQAEVYASTLCLTKAEIAKAQGDLLGDSSSWKTYNLRNLETLREAGLPE